MWKSNESTSETPKNPAQDARPQASPAPSPARPASSSGRTATIGPSISIKGDISGDEDLVIEGQVEGAVQLSKHDVTVASSGQVTADIRGKRICIDGKVVGDLFGDEVVIRKSGRVQGNAKAPRVTLENGCQFRGSIDMKPKNGAGKQQASAGGGSVGAR